MLGKEWLGRRLGRHRIDQIRGLLGQHLDFDEVRLVNEAFWRVGVRGVMIDVGAHHGSCVAMFANDGWRVFAFEPDDLNRDSLVHAFGAHANVTIDPRAVSDRLEFGKAFFSSEVSTGISGFLAFHESHIQSQTVDVTTLADVLDEYSIDHVDLLKIDAEGYDLFVLRGLDWTGDKPDVIVCEFENNKTTRLGYSTDHMAVFLAGVGYEVVVSEWHPIERYGAQHRWKGFRRSTEGLSGDSWGHLIAHRAGYRLDDLEFDRIGRLSARLFGR